MIEGHRAIGYGLYTLYYTASIQKCGFGETSNAEDTDEKCLILKPTSQRTF